MTYSLTYLKSDTNDHCYLAFLPIWNQIYISHIHIQENYQIIWLWLNQSLIF